VDDPETKATWNTRYKTHTSKAQYSTVTPEGAIIMDNPVSQTTWSIRYRVALCFACLLSVSYAPYCMCLWGRSLLIVPSTVTLLYCVCLSSVSILCSILPVSGVVHSRLSLQRLLCCIVFCLCSFCILCSMLPLSLGSSTLDCPFNGYCVVTKATWSIRYRTNTNKTQYNKVTVEGTIKSERPQRQRKHGA
jgi:hypothetical protein